MRAGLFLASCLALLWIAGLNGGPLFYFDTTGYLLQGAAALEQLGFELPREVIVAAPKGAVTTEGGDVGQTGVSGNRSILYGLWLALAFAIFGPGLAMLPQVALILVGHMLLMRSVLPEAGAWQWMLPLMAACLSTLPFYSVYLMPDVLAVLPILVAAWALGWGDRAGWGAVAVAGLFAALGVMMHLSHLGIAVLLIPVSLVLGLGLRIWGERRRWWLAPVLMTLVAGLGLAERVGFALVVEHQASAEVTYAPFLTARLIVDGPGVMYLEGICDVVDDREPACLLLAQLEGQPARRNVSRILFDPSPERGSYLLLPEETQRRISNGQRAFFFATLRHDPVATLTVLLRNSEIQLRRISIWQTLGDPMVVKNAAALQRLGPAVTEAMQAPRLMRGAGWVASVETIHVAISLLALAITLFWIFWPGTSVASRVFLVAVLAGLVANAVICGAFSQPAPRYGARVIWLLPYIAVIGGLLTWRGVRRP